MTRLEESTNMILFGWHDPPEKSTKCIRREYQTSDGGACGVVVIVVENEHGDTSSNPGRDWLHFT